MRALRFVGRWLLALVGAAALWLLSFAFFSCVGVDDIPTEQDIVHEYLTAIGCVERDGGWPLWDCSAVELICGGVD